MNTGSSRLLNHYAELRPSALHGMGLFAKRVIPANTIWWKATRNNVLLLNHRQYSTFLNSESNETMDGLLQLSKVYGYYSKKLDSIVVCLDNARYVNHSIEPNSGAPSNGNPLCSLSLRDIMVGEEITEHYGAYDLCPWSDITCSDSFIRVEAMS